MSISKGSDMESRVRIPSNEELAEIVVPGFDFVPGRSTSTHAVHVCGRLTVYTPRAMVPSLARALTERGARDLLEREPLEGVGAGRGRE